MSGFRKKRMGNLLVLAFVLGVICSLILPVWCWLLVAGAALIIVGCKILVD
ncbi:MAG: hypothetical protein PHS69_02010 [Firmicutes bacterium]|nr:hypothetical protein [Bacillota bacterium]MDD3297520.1 hypothetical protein [Bacillota bacterium]MDD4706916.1 hypothetical protein [Bacillota bacterium]